MEEISRKGLFWDDGGLDIEPRWATEPDVAAIKGECLRTLGIRDPDDCTVKFLTAGAFNKIYLVEPQGQRNLIMRVSLPVDPRYKTAGEVATLRWIRRSTTIPVPEVIAYRDSSDNATGYEWILMELMPGTSVYSVWRKMSLTAKKSLAEQVAGYQAQLFKAAQDAVAFQKIGTLSDINDENTDTTPHRIVSRLFFWGQHFNFDVPRGPFHSSYDWLNTCISIIVKEQHTAIEEAGDEDEREDAKFQLRIAEKLRTLLPKIFPAIQNPQERTVLYHDDLSLSNMLVDNNGAIVAVIDWEFVSAIPLWAATEMPKFLCGPQREEEPNRDIYADESPEDADEYRKSTKDSEILDNEGKDELFWIHMMEYDQTQLRKAYAERMRQLVPGWYSQVADSNLRNDFLGAVDRCAYGWFLKGIDRWIDMIERGEFHRLDDVLDPTILI
ncbi:hypothetical protein G7Z17_g11980 [Cylindrodendrum hubeiense]|uniref:Aminoglycoside phosphotransferase domain-containing protein n=1 Tax=Cylindrodendrum hubeiense TaxID=595255 RepID=A0A9P5GZ79_9HYPO|nr:hypothetical protein G7Z17_g11980 [Cylindrodendrum hubeiense]